VLKAHSVWPQHGAEPAMFEQREPRVMQHCPLVHVEPAEQATHAAPRAPQN
jgi:hypothetical protein